MAALPPAENFPNPGGKVAAEATLPRGTFSETDSATKVTPPPAKMFSDLEGIYLTPASKGRPWVTPVTPQWQLVPPALVVDLFGRPSTAVAILPRDARSAVPGG